jgi:hypothetical protein
MKKPKYYLNLARKYAGLVFIVVKAVHWVIVHVSGVTNYSVQELRVSI